MRCIFEDRAESVKGEFAIGIYRQGRLVREWSDHNLVVLSGRHRLAEMAAGKSTSHITYIGVGSGREKEKDADTSLTEQQLFPVAESTVTDQDARFDFVIGEDQANGLSIREFGLFCTDETMFSHRVRIHVDEDTKEEKVLTIDKESDIEIRGYWIIHF